MGDGKQSTVKQMWLAYDNPTRRSERKALSLVPSVDRATVVGHAAAVEHASPIKHAMTTIVLHWSTVAAVVMAIAAIYLRDFTEDRVLRQFLLDAHRQLLLLVMIAVPLRIFARLWLGFANQTSGMWARGDHSIKSVPQDARAFSPPMTLMRWAAAMTHVALYAFLIALPVIGLAATSAKGITLNLLGLMPLPSLTEPDPDVADALIDYHTWGAWALMGLVAVHALAALWHHFYLKDGVLRAMLPGRLSPVAAVSQRRHAQSPVGYERRRVSIPVEFDRRSSFAS